ncbi:MAG: hypothetical protein KDA51_07665 [Planctomycetales bacterium]|nr:hypothetical protein [Planctomycetaceae bacterium]MCA9181314.1 hypothetical protein [Planctomycetales bacterium]
MQLGRIARFGGLSTLWITLLCTASFAQEAAESEVRTAPELTAKWLILHQPQRASRNIQPLTTKHLVVQLDAFQLTGPAPGHPHVLGEFVADGHWGIVQGAIQRTGGKNAVLELARANQFELQGRMEQAGQGGWFLLVGWADGHGYCLSNAVQKTSSPWFLTEFRGGKALANQHTEFPGFDWNGSQPLRLQVEKGELTLQVGQQFVFEKQKLANYQAGAIILGTYDCKYGPRPLRLQTLRGREIPQ